MQKLWLRFAGIAMALALAAGTAYAQDVNVKEEEEQLNFNRAVKDSVDNFRVLRTDTKAEMNDYVTRVFELKNASAMEVVPYVRTAVTKEQGSVATLRYVDPQSGQVRNWIQVVAPLFQMPGIEELVRSFDLPGVTSSPGDVRFFYRMQNRNASDVNNILKVTELSGDGSSAFDSATNTIYFRDSASDFSRDIAVVKFMDVPVPQVEFDVEIFELEKSDEARLGLYWDAWKNALGGAVAVTGSSLGGNSGYEALGAIGGTAAAQFLNYLVDQGAGKVLTKSRVSVQNGEPATISSLRRIPYQAYTGALTVGMPAPLGQNVTAALLQEQTAPNQPGGANEKSSVDPGTVTGEKSDGIYLSIVPTIGVRTLSADILVTVNSLVGFTKLDVPIITERRTSTVATLTPGKIFILGGMDKETVVKERRYIPVLGDIPGLGRLFSYDTDVADKTVLIVSIKPTVKNQLLYKSMALGWGQVPENMGGQVPEGSKTVPEGITEPNADANVGEDSLNKAEDAGPALRWGEDLWRNE